MTSESNTPFLKSKSLNAYAIRASTLGVIASASSLNGAVIYFNPEFTSNTGSLAWDMVTGTTSDSFFIAADYTVRFTSPSINPSLAVGQTTTPVGPNQDGRDQFFAMAGSVSAVTPGESISSLSFGPDIFGDLGTEFNAPGGDYIGLTFTNTDSDSNLETFFGWARVSLNSATQEITLHEFAWNDTAGADIEVAAVPEPSSSVLLLTGGAAGLLAFRNRRREEKATASNA